MPGQQDSPEGFVRLGRDAPAQRLASESAISVLPGPSRFGELIDQGLELLRNNFVFLTVLAGAFNLAIVWGMEQMSGMSAGFEVTPSQGFGAFLALMAISVLQLAFLVGVAGSLALAGRHPDPDRRVGFAGLRDAHLGTGLLAALVSGVLVVLASLPIFPLGIYLAFRLTYAPTAGLHDGEGPVAAIKHSWRLTGGVDLFGRWIGLIVVASLLGVIPSGMASALQNPKYTQQLGDLLGLDFASLSMVLKPIGSYLGGISTALLVAAVGRFHLELLASREGLDLRRRLAVISLARAGR